MRSKILDSSLDSLLTSSSKKLGKSLMISNRVQILQLSCRHGVTEISKLFEISRSTIYGWAKNFRDGGIEALANRPKHKGGLILKDVHKKEVRRLLSQNPNITIKEVRLYLKDNYDIDICKSAVHNAMHNCGYSYITGRKRHYKQNKAAAEKFKKN
jgi:transposase